MARAVSGATPGSGGVSSMPRSSQRPADGAFRSSQVFLPDYLTQVARAQLVGQRSVLARLVRRGGG